MFGETKGPWWGYCVIDDATGEELEWNDYGMSTGELQLTLAYWSDDRLALHRASICFGEV